MGGPISSWETREAEKYGHRESPPEAEGASAHALYSEVGKAHYQGKDVTEGRSPHRHLMPDPVGAEHPQPPSLRGRANTARVDKRHRCRDLYRGRDAELLRPCGPDLNQEAARGGDNVTAEAYAEPLHANIEALAQRLQTKGYRATLVRRGSLPKENGKKGRWDSPHAQINWCNEPGRSG